MKKFPPSRSGRALPAARIADPIPALLLALILGLAALIAAPALAGERSPTVVELYTSQGCSSCPPADAYMGRLAKRDDVLPLSFHVDYWDYIGWKDPFASPAHSDRQRAYASIFARSYVYTPQVVIHGIAETSGTNFGDLERKIQRAGRAPDTAVRLTLEDAGGLMVVVSAVPYPVDAAVWLVLFDTVHKTRVRRGENRGRTIHNFNVVRGIRKIGKWRGKELSIRVPAAHLKLPGGNNGAVIIQAESKGPILGAQRISLAFSG